MVYTRRPSDQRCEEIYACITEYVAENGHSPTFREVGNAVGLRSSSTVSRYIHRLVDEGRITIDESKPRTLTAAAPATNEGRMLTHDEYSKKAQPARRKALRVHRLSPAENALRL